MELDNFKNLKHRHMLSGNNDPEIEENISRITESFRTYESQLKRRKLMYITIDIMLAIVYIALVNIHTGIIATGYYILGAGCAAGALYLYLRYRPVQPYIYSLPVTEFLEKAKYKISYFNMVDYIIIIPLLLLLGTGGGIVFIMSILKYTDNLTLLLIIWVLFFAFISVFGFYAGRRNWMKEFGSLYMNINEMQNNIESTRISDTENDNQ